MKVFVCYALPAKQTVIELDTSQPYTAQQAVTDSNILEEYTELADQELVIGIYGKKQPLDTLLNPFDRVEIYRPLLLTPVEARTLRAQQTHL